MCTFAWRAFEGKVHAQVMRTLIQCLSHRKSVLVSMSQKACTSWDWCALAHIYGHLNWSRSCPYVVTWQTSSYTRHLVFLSVSRSTYWHIRSLNCSFFLFFVEPADREVSCIQSSARTLKSKVSYDCVMEDYVKMVLLLSVTPLPIARL